MLIFAHLQVSLCNKIINNDNITMNSLCALVLENSQIFLIQHHLLQHGGVCPLNGLEFASLQPWPSDQSLLCIASDRIKTLFPEVDTEQRLWEASITCVTLIPERFGWTRCFSLLFESLRNSCFNGPSTMNMELWTLHTACRPFFMRVLRVHHTLGFFS